MPARAQEKYLKLKVIIEDLGSAVVAFSGGVDSSLLLHAAREALGNNLIAVTERSPLVPEREIQNARRVAAAIGVEHLILDTERLPDAVRRNPEDRCYWCKRGLFRRLEKIAEENDCAAILEGTNADDLKDFRPGIQAAKETHVRQPLAEAKLTKSEVRELARRFGLPTWQKESEACLASRIRFGISITDDRLRRVARGEAYLRKQGFNQVRVRLTDETSARVEVDPKQVADLFAQEPAVKEYLGRLGFQSVVLDPAGYRSGSLNDATSRS